MNTNQWLLFGFSMYVATFLAAVIVVLRKRRRNRNERPPVEFKLLRAPGESLRRRISKLDEDLAFHLLGAIIVPAGIGLLVIWILAKATPHMSLWLGLTIAVMCLLVSAALAGRWVLRRLLSIDNYQLGYMGERAVGEALDPLVPDGYRVFHDIPVSTGDRKFNLDHVVVGPTGLFLIETKTRRKGRAREGYKDHVVTYDGTQLIWPWAEDRHGLNQAQKEAEWLTEWIEKLLGLKITAKPILALPGWYVKAKARVPVNVVNPKNLAIAIKGRGQVELSPEQIDLIARQLDAVCRDVID